jgi:hypothetical protein
MLGAVLLNFLQIVARGIGFGAIAMGIQISPTRTPLIMQQQIVRDPVSLRLSIC